MPYKDPEKRRECRRRWYLKNKKSEKAHVKKRKLEIRKWFEEYKKGLRCNSCEEDHPATIDFHHPRNVKKDNGISHLVSNGYSIGKIKKEIDKCEVLCSNCHRKEHYKTVNFKTKKPKIK